MFKLSEQEPAIQQIDLTGAVIGISRQWYDEAKAQLEAYEKAIEATHEVMRVQGADGNWNNDPYMHGLYNGMEMIRSMFEAGPAEFRDAPEKWGCDEPEDLILKDDNNVPKLSEAPAIYMEEGWVAEVEILEDSSDEKWGRYKLKVIKTLGDSLVFKAPEIGHVFTVDSKRGYEAYRGWQLLERGDYING